MRMLLAMVILAATASAAEPDLKLQFAASPPAVLIAQAPCTKGHETYLIINAADGEAVRISQCDGKVTLAHPERADEAARAFWHAVETGFGKRCADAQSGHTSVPRETSNKP